MSDPQAIERDMEMILSEISTMKMKVEAGEGIATQNLQMKVTRICTDVKGLEPSDAKLLQPKMAEILAGLSSLEFAIEQQKEILNERLKGF